MMRAAVLSFFQSYGVQRDLHSFPTRRSSDLRSTKIGASPSDGSSSRSNFGRAISARPIAHRSEEHTSELQSHSDLVCRLLLEKKNLAMLDVPGHRDNVRPGVEIRAVLDASGE